MSQVYKIDQKINLVFADLARPECLTKIPQKSRKMNKRAGPNKSVQAGSLVKIKKGVHARLLIIYSGL